MLSKEEILARATGVKPETIRKFPECTIDIPDCLLAMQLYADQYKNISQQQLFIENITVLECCYRPLKKTHGINTELAYAEMTLQLGLKTYGNYDRYVVNGKFNIDKLIIGLLNGEIIISNEI